MQTNLYQLQILQMIITNSIPNPNHINLLFLKSRNNSTYRLILLYQGKRVFLIIFLITTNRTITRKNHITIEIIITDEYLLR